MFPYCSPSHETGIGGSAATSLGWATLLIAIGGFRRRSGISPGTVVAAGAFVILHGRYSGLGLLWNWIVADIVRMKDGILEEHWDVIQDEATREASKSGLPLFGEEFASERPKSQFAIYSSDSSLRPSRKNDAITRMSLLEQLTTAELIPW